MMVKSVLRDWHSFLHWSKNTNTPQTWWSNQSWETGTHSWTGVKYKHTSDMMVKSVLRDWHSFLHWTKIQTHLTHDGQVSPERLTLLLHAVYEGRRCFVSSRLHWSHSSHPFIILKRDPPPPFEHGQCIQTVHHILVQYIHLAQSRREREVALW